MVFYRIRHTEYMLHQRVCVSLSTSLPVLPRYLGHCRLQRSHYRAEGGCNSLYFTPRSAVVNDALSGHVVHDPVDSDREECWRKYTALPHSRCGLESTGQSLATTYSGPCVLVQCHYEVQEDVWDFLAPHSLPQCSPVD